MWKRVDLVKVATFLPRYKEKENRVIKALPISYRLKITIF